MKQFLKEPLLQFVLLGAALFGAYGFINRTTNKPPGEIVVSAGQIEHLATTFSRFKQRPPTPEELQGLIDEYVREEALSREAINLGLDRDDTIIRRRLQQKMEFVANDLASANEPTEGELADWLAKHPDNFRQEERFSFRQVFISQEKRGARSEADISKLLKELKQAGPQVDVNKLGDSVLLPCEFAGASQSAIAAQFGSDFASQLTKLNVSEWTGPIRSGYGAHLVLLTARTESRSPVLDEVREQVKRDFMSERRLEGNRHFFDAVLTKYRVKIEWATADVVNGHKIVAKSP